MAGGGSAVAGDRIDSLRLQLLQARRHLGGLLQLTVPIEPVDGGQPEQAQLAELAAQADRLHALAARLCQGAREVAERVRRVEAGLHGPHPTV